MPERMKTCYNSQKVLFQVQFIVTTICPQFKFGIARKLLTFTGLFRHEVLRVISKMFMSPALWSDCSSVRKEE